MKTTIRADGMLSVKAESDLEAYALNQWSRQNFGEGYTAMVPPIKIIVDLSAYAATMGLFVSVGGRHQQ